MMNNSENRKTHIGDHLPKISNSDTINRIAKVLKNNPDATQYDRPEDDGQSLLAHKTPGSLIGAQKNNGIPSWKRYAGD